MHKKIAEDEFKYVEPSYEKVQSEPGECLVEHAEKPQKPQPPPLPVKDKAKSDERFAQFAKGLVRIAISYVRDYTKKNGRPPLVIDTKLHVITEAGSYNVVLELNAPNQVAVSGTIPNDYEDMMKDKK